MNYKTHINGGILTVLYVVNAQVVKTTLLTSGILAGGIIVGSILPDIDHKNSFISKRNKIISRIISIIAGHRKLFHAPLFYTAIYLITIMQIKSTLLLILVKGIFLGIMSHLILDIITLGGLPILYPFSKKKLSLGNIKTDGFLEHILCVIIIVINIFILFKSI